MPALLGERNSNHKLTAVEVEMMRGLAARGVSGERLASLFFVSRGSISKALRGITWPSCGGPIQPKKDGGRGQVK